MVLFLFLAGGSPSILLFSRDRKGLCFQAGVLFMQTFLNYYYPLFYSSKRHVKCIERLLPKQAASMQLVLQYPQLCWPVPWTRSRRRDAGRSPSCAPTRLLLAFTTPAAHSAGLPDCIYSFPAIWKTMSPSKCSVSGSQMNIWKTIIWQSLASSAMPGTPAQEEP